MLSPYIYDTSGVPDRLQSGNAPDLVARKQEVRRELRKLQKVIYGSGAEGARGGA